MAQAVKNLPVMQETRVRSLSWEDSPGEGTGNPLPGEFHAEDLLPPGDAAERSQEGQGDGALGAAGSAELGGPVEVASSSVTPSVTGLPQDSL